MSDRRHAVLVTGAASGIGAAVARRFAAAGDAVALLDRDADRLAAVVTDCGGASHAIAVAGDVRDPAASTAAVDAALGAFGGLSRLVTCAGIALEGRVGEQPLEDWQATIDVVLHGTFHACRAALPALRAATPAAIVTVGSVISDLVMPGWGAYAAAKAGVASLTRTLALEEAAAGVRANCVLPGSTDTPMMWQDVPAETLPAARAEIERAVPLGRIAGPAEIAEVVWFLCSPAASFVTGATLAADGGGSVRLAAER